MEFFVHRRWFGYYDLQLPPMTLGQAAAPFQRIHSSTLIVILNYGQDQELVPTEA